MLTKVVPNSVLLIVDSHNSGISARQAHGPQARLDRKRLRERCMDGAILIHAIEVAPSPRSDGGNGFFATLRALGYEVVMTGPPPADDEEIERQLVDARISSTGVFERVVLASGDGDFASACREVRGRGTAVTIAAFPMALSRDLRAVADEVWELGWADLWYPASVGLMACGGQHPAVPNTDPGERPAAPREAT